MHSSLLFEFSPAPSLFPFLCCLNYNWPFVTSFKWIAQLFRLLASPFVEFSFFYFFCLCHISTLIIRQGTAAVERSSSLALFSTPPLCPTDTIGDPQLSWILIKPVKMYPNLNKHQSFTLPWLAHPSSVRLCPIMSIIKICLVNFLRREFLLLF